MEQVQHLPSDSPAATEHSQFESISGDRQTRQTPSSSSSDCAKQDFLPVGSQDRTEIKAHLL